MEETGLSVFELIMLICFGAAWPLSIYKSWTSRRNTGKSILFLFVLIIGYIAGILHKLIYNYDAVIFLYILNVIMVSTDAALYFRNKRIQKAEGM